jgi:hypothetical protein
VLVTIDYTTLNDFGYAIVPDLDYCFSNTTSLWSAWAQDRMLTSEKDSEFWPI